MFGARYTPSLIPLSNLPIFLLFFWLTLSASVVICYIFPRFASLLSIWAIFLYYLSDHLLDTLQFPYDHSPLSLYYGLQNHHLFMKANNNQLTYIPPLD